MKTLFKTAIAVLILQSGLGFSQEIKQDSTKTNALEEVIVTSTRVNEKSPFAFTNLKKETLSSTNLGQDLPVLLDQLPSVVTTSDAGAGVGYTGLRVRGSDATRVNVTVNGIPYNDAESHGSYFVDLPDFTSSVEDIQLQRGAGTSTNGTGAFGASLNLRTLKPSDQGYATIANSVGSFGTLKHTLNIGSGIKNGFYAEGRLSKISSNGYIDRATSDLKSFYTEAGYIGTKTTLKALAFGGKEITYQSWYGTPEAIVYGNKNDIQAFIDRNGYSMSPAEIDNVLNAKRTFNYYLYENQVDNYAQNHYQFHVAHEFSKFLTANISLNYTKGKGYYEEFKYQTKLSKYYPDSPNGSDQGDVIRRKWLDNNFYALVYSLNYKKDNLNLSLGGGYNIYKGNHFGEIIWNSFPTVIAHDAEYYRSKGNKEDYSVFGKAEYMVSPKLLLYGDLQVRGVDYSATGITSDVRKVDVHKQYTFFNPKTGLSFSLNDNHLVYASISVANKEPNRTDLTKNPISPVSEQLLDYELGYKFKHEKYAANVNFYYMHYNNQLVLTGALDDVGDAIRQNVSKSYRAGIEIQGSAKIAKQWKLDVNTTLSQNKIKQFDYVVFDTQYDPITYAETYNQVITTYKKSDISFSPKITGGATLQFLPLKNLNLSVLSKYVGKQFLDNTSSNDRMMKDYWTNNFSATFKITPKWIKEIDFNLLVNNFLNRKYVSNGYTYSYYYRPQGSSDNPVTENFYYPQAGINFITGVTLKF